MAWRRTMLLADLQALDELRVDTGDGKGGWVAYFAPESQGTGGGGTSASSEVDMADDGLAIPGLENDDESGTDDEEWDGGASSSRRSGNYDERAGPGCYWP